MMFDNYLTVEELAESLGCSQRLARDRIEQVNLYFNLLGQPTKGIFRDGRKVMISEDSIREFLEATSNRFYEMHKWREPIIELVREIQK